MRGHEPNSSNSTDGTMIVSYRRKLKRCWAHLTADRRKFRAFGLLLAVAVVLWAKPVGLLLWARIKIITNIPRTAIAEDEPLLTKMTPDSSRGVPALPESEKLHLSVWPMKDPFRIDQYFMPHTAQNSSLLQTEPKLGGDQAEDLPIREASKEGTFRGVRSRAASPRTDDWTSRNGNYQWTHVPGLTICSAPSGRRTFDSDLLKSLVTLLLWNSTLYRYTLP